MGLSAFCIRRPVFTILLMVSLLAAGVAGYRALPVSALPSIDMPTIQVTASLAGASAETMASSVATPLERQFSTISGISSMTSSSSLGSTRITLQFDLDRQIDGAALDVQTAISAAQRNLPREMTTPPSFRKVNPADQPVLFLAVSSDTLPLSQVNEYADTILAQRISMVPGVAQAMIYGEKKYAVRVRVNPEQIAAQNMSLDDVKQAIAGAASNSPLGSIYGPQQLFNIRLDGQPDDAAGFKAIITGWRNGAPVRLGDIADVTDDVSDTRQAAFLNGKPAVIVAVQRQPDANTIDVVKRIRDLLPTLRSQIPASVEITPTMDRSIAIEHSVSDVQFTLLLTFGLVSAVIFLFLGNVRATIIPALAVPLSIIATYGGMQLLGFSLNNISLLALTLCVGFVVDDAIVMLENIIRHVENGERPMTAALMGAQEVGFTIISMTFSLIAVFIPVLFMGGIVGRLFREFALTISMSILFSGLIALTLTPLMCSRILRDMAAPHQGTTNKQNKFFSATLRAYERSLVFVLQHKPVTLIATFILLAASIWSFIAAPKGFFPNEDTGFINGSTEAAQDISYEAMLAKQKQVAEIIRQNPNVATVFSSTGGGRGSSNSGNLFISLKDRPRDAAPLVIQQLRTATSDIPGIKMYLQPVQNIQIGGRPSKSQYQYTLQGTNLDELYSATSALIAEMSANSAFQDVTSDMQLNSPQAIIRIDQDAASRAGISYTTVRETLYTAYGSSKAASIYTSTNDYDVILEAGQDFQKSVDDIGRLYVTGTSGTTVPLSAIATVTRGVAPLSINHQGQLPSVTVSFNLASGFSLGDAVEMIQTMQEKMKLPASLTGNFQGTAQAFQDSLAGQGALLFFAILVIYIILGMLYESFIHPLTILSGLPSAGLGAVLTLMLFRMDLSVISIIGIVLLIGIVKKNAIMMVDFALQARAAGATAEDAIFQACILRFRPIMMTTMAAIFGTLPIALGLGAGAELRQPLGIAVVGGLFVSQILTLYITPVIYLYLERMRPAPAGPSLTS